MRYQYVRAFHPGRRYLETAPLDVHMLSEGLFAPDDIARLAAPPVSACFLPADAPGSGRPAGIGPDASIPMTAVDEDMRRGIERQGTPSRARAQYESEMLRRRQMAVSQSPWGGRQSGPPARPAFARSQPLAPGPVSGRAAGRAGLATAVATASVVLFRHSLISDLKSRLRSLEGRIQQTLSGSRFGVAMCSAVYTYFVFRDDIGNNDPRLYSIQIRTPPDLVGRRGGPTDAFEYVAHLFRTAPPPGRPTLSASRFEEHVYGNFDRDFVANRAWASAYILMPRG